MRKLDDYQEHERFSRNLQRLAGIEQIIHSREFIGQMNRFLTFKTIEQTISREAFLANMTETIISLYRTVGVEI